MLGKKIQQLRKENGMSQEELASKLTISRQAISKWELGESMPDTENVVQLSKLFGVSTDYLLYDEFESEKDAAEAETSAEKAEIMLFDNQEERAEIKQEKKRLYKRPEFWIVIAVAIVMIPFFVFIISALFLSVNDSRPDAPDPPDVIIVVTPTPPSPDLQPLVITYSGRQVSDFTLVVGEVITLGVNVPSHNSGVDIEWRSSDQSIFEVVLTNTTGSEAMVTAISRGTATLSVTVGGFRAECIVRVIQRDGQTDSVVEATPPVDKELVRDYIQQYMRLITDGDTAELARFLLIDGGVTDEYLEIARLVIDYYSQYDTRRATVQSVDYHETETELQYTIRQYIILVRDGRGEMFTVYAGYGDGLVGIDVRQFR